MSLDQAHLTVSETEDSESYQFRVLESLIEAALGEDS
jgi:hypothetical protein